MNYKIVKALNVCILFLASLFVNMEQITIQHKTLQESNLSCTNFAASINETILFGNSEDGGLGSDLYVDPLSSHMFYYPADAEGHGCAFVGWLKDGYIRGVQGGMNDQGLCYDLTGIPSAPMNPHPEKPYRIGGNWIQRDILRQNANVSEAIDFLNNVYWEGNVWYQWFFADSSGDMVIVSPGPDGELAFTRKEAGVDGFLTQTNFNRITNDSEPGNFPCWRYDISTEMLGDIDNEEDLTLDAMDSVLEAVHFDREGSFTGYSNAFDPRNQILHLTLLAQYDDTVAINVTEELDITEVNIVPMSDYFSQETIEKGLSYYNAFKTRLIIVRFVLPITGLIVIIISLVLTIRFVIKRIRKKKKSEVVAIT
ncbi:MAG: hypothetical protein FK733_19665 [Asgard group archaeon]|nr:hypothetical protein [Asgard group archaeon]